MVTIRDIMDPVLFDRMVREGFVRIQRHPTLDLAIANYSEQAVYDNEWNQVTRQCRGLIWRTQTGEVVARPFPKFWSADQLSGRPDLGVVPVEPFKIFDKLDGSLAILYPDGNGHSIATRGSFTSDQALHATKVWKHRYECFNQPRFNYTFLFEIIYPDNRIVLDYGDLDDLVLLGAVHDATGRSIDPRLAAYYLDWEGPVVETYEMTEDARPNREGYVLWYPKSDLRLKIKHPEYVRLHAIVTMANTKTVWRALREGDDGLRSLLDLPDEFRGAVESCVEQFQDDFVRLEIQGIILHNAVAQLPTRKEQAEVIKDLGAGHPTAQAVAFRRLDGKDYAEVIWKALEPEQAESLWR